MFPLIFFIKKLFFHSDGVLGGKNFPSWAEKSKEFSSLRLEVITRGRSPFLWASDLRFGNFSVVNWKRSRGAGEGRVRGA